MILLALANLTLDVLRVRRVGGGVCADAKTGRPIGDKTAEKAVVLSRH